MSKIITRRIIRIVQTTIQSNQTTISAINNANQNAHSQTIQGLPAAITGNTRYTTISSIKAMDDAGFGNVGVRINNNVIHISGNNRNGEIFVAELPIDQHGEVTTIRTDTLNIEECNKAEERFNNSLKARGIQYEVTEIYDSNTKRKPPVPLRDKIEKVKRFSVQDRGRMRN